MYNCNVGDLVVERNGKMRPSTEQTCLSATTDLQGEMHAATALTALGVFSAISTYPVHNPHTAYTAIMSAATGIASLIQVLP